MFTDLRNELGLTRSQLSELTGRSQNYILKAESLTFPSPPVALVDFYCNPANLTNLTTANSNFTPQDPEVLKEEYRAAQRAKRERWLADWIPRPLDTKHFSLRRKWLARYELDDEVCPTEYRVSQGLCVPAAAVYRAEKDGFINTAIHTALSDLVDYCLSGRYFATHGIEDGDYSVVEGVLRIQKELSS